MLSSVTLKTKAITTTATSACSSQSLCFHRVRVHRHGFICLVQGAFVLDSIQQNNTDHKSSAKSGVKGNEAAIRVQRKCPHAAEYFGYNQT